MRRIDLFCKLIGPLAISLIAGFSAQTATLATFGMSLASVAAEYFAIPHVCKFKTLHAPN